MNKYIEPTASLIPALSDASFVVVRNHRTELKIVTCHNVLQIKPLAMTCIGYKMGMNLQSLKNENFKDFSLSFEFLHPGRGYGF